MKRTINTKLITTLLEHGMFRTEHYPQYLVFYGGYSSKINFAVYTCRVVEMMMNDLITLNE